VAFLDVSSTGRLIPAGTAGDLFEPFHRLEPEPGDQRPRQGVGLGLAIV
jgi:K+-sensing histidine kinase KdpD